MEIIAVFIKPNMRSMIFAIKDIKMVASNILKVAVCNIYVSGFVID